MLDFKLYWCNGEPVLSDVEAAFQLMLKYNFSIAVQLCWYEFNANRKHTYTIFPEDASTTTPRRYFNRLSKAMA